MNYEEKRKTLVNSLIKRNILTKQEIINAMLSVPREKFIPKDARSSAYVDSPLSIGSGQTISAPHMNAMMCEYLELKEGDKLLEVGTGSGYHAALCATIIAPQDSTNPGHVYTIERYEDLAVKAQDALNQTGYGEHVTVIHGDGTLGYPDQAPYDKILVTAASPSKVPPPLLNQLAEGGLICIPAGAKSYGQTLYVIKKEGKEYKKEKKCGVRFVPLIGEYGFE